MTARAEHKRARDIDATWLGQRVTVAVTTEGKVETLTGGLSDYEVCRQHVVLHIGGRTVYANPNANVTRGGLDVLGGAA